MPPAWGGVTGPLRETRKTRQSGAPPSRPPDTAPRGEPHNHCQLSNSGVFIIRKHSSRTCLEAGLPIGLRTAWVRGPLRPGGAFPSLHLLSPPLSDGLPYKGSCQPEECKGAHRHRRAEVPSRLPHLPAGRLRQIPRFLISQSLCFLLVK